MLQIGICMLVVVFVIHSITVRHATAHTTSYKFFLNGWKGFRVRVAFNIYEEKKNE